MGLVLGMVSHRVQWIWYWKTEDGNQGRQKQREDRSEVKLKSSLGWLQMCLPQIAWAKGMKLLVNGGWQLVKWRYCLGVSGFDVKEMRKSRLSTCMSMLRKVIWEGEMILVNKTRLRLLRHSRKRWRESWTWIHNKKISSINLSQQFKVLWVQEVLLCWFHEEINIGGGPFSSPLLCP